MVVEKSTIEAVLCMTEGRGKRVGLTDNQKSYASQHCVRFALGWSTEGHDWKVRFVGQRVQANEERSKVKKKKRKQEKSES